MDQRELPGMPCRTTGCENTADDFGDGYCSVACRATDEDDDGYLPFDLFAKV